MTCLLFPIICEGTDIYGNSSFWLQGNLYDWDGPMDAVGILVQSGPLPASMVSKHSGRRVFVAYLTGHNVGRKTVSSAFVTGSFQAAIGAINSYDSLRLPERSCSLMISFLSRFQMA